MSNQTRTKTERQLLAAEAILTLVLAVLFMIVALDDETPPAFAGAALSLVLVAVVVWRAARTGG